MYGSSSSLWFALITLLRYISFHICIMSENGNVCSEIYNQLIVTDIKSIIVR